MRVTVIRTAMCGGGLSYDVYVKCGDVPAQCLADANGNYHTRIVRDRADYFDFVDATQPAEDRAMPQGWERYERHQAHEKEARREMLAIVRRAYPEMLAYTGDLLPTLWVTGLDVVPETSAVKHLTYHAPVAA